MRAVVLSLALVALFVALVRADADTCLQFPAVIGYGGICNGGVHCQFGSYCSESSICTVNEKVGNLCTQERGCEVGATCQNSNSEIGATCVLDAHPGQDCDSSASSTLPRCGTGSCNGNHRCVNGNVGDACFANSDCLSNSCLNQLCAPLASGATCVVGADQCAPGTAYCNPTTLKCSNRQTQGKCDTTTRNQCAYGYDCLLTSATSATTSCVQRGSIADGDLCFNSLSCAHHRCLFRGNSYGYCAAKSTKYCFGDSDCAYDERCDCFGLIYDGGFMGTCQAFPCQKNNDAFAACIDANCQSTTYFNGSCSYLNCKDLSLTFMACNSASGLVSSLLLVSLMTLLVTFFSKKF